MRKKIVRGVSLLEVLLAASILAIGFLFLLGMFPATITGISGAQNMYSASQIATQELVYWENQGWNSIDCGALTHPKTPPCSGTLYKNNITITSQNNGAAKEAKFSYQIIMSDPPQTLTPASNAQLTGGVVQLQVFVQWHQPLGGLGGIGPLDSVEEDTWVVK